MKRFYFLFFLLVCKSGLMMMAQSPIFDALSKKQANKGTVAIHQTSTVQKLVGSHSADDKTETVGDKSYLVVQGYRIQVFSGNNQRKSKDEAFGKKGQIDNLYSNVSTYVTYTAPFWRLRVGDYTTYEEAFSMMCKLTDSFPTFKKEIHILKEEVRIPLN